MPDLLLAVDFGASATKLSYRLGKSDDDSSKFQVTLMPPHVEPINLDKLERYLNRNTIHFQTVSELKEIWIETKGEQLYALGSLANQFDPVDLIKDVKYEVAAYKTLGAIGYALSTYRQSKQLPKKKVYQVALATLLPWDEFPDKERFKSFVESLLSSWKYRGTHLGVKLVSFSVRQEGFGLFYLHHKSRNFSSVSQLTILMFGHRNLSALVFKDNQLSQGASPLLGFHQVLDGVADKISWLDREQVNHALSKAWLSYGEHFFSGTYWANNKENSTHLKQFEQMGEYDHYVRLEMKYPCWLDLKPIQSLARAKDPDLRQAEISDIHQAITQALDDYWESFLKWYEPMLKGDFLQFCLVSGGASWFILPKLAACSRYTIFVGLNRKYTDFHKCRQPSDFVKKATEVYRAALFDNNESFYKFRERCYRSETFPVTLVERTRLYELVSKFGELSQKQSLSMYVERYTKRQRTADVVGLSAYLLDRSKNG